MIYLFFSKSSGYVMYTSEPRCIGHQQFHKYNLDYMKDALKYYNKQNIPQFSFLVEGESHDGYFKSLYRVDNDFMNYLKEIEENGVFENSMVIIMGDHGMHFGPYYETKVLYNL